MKKIIWLYLTAIFFLGEMMGCAMVQPWEREYLANEVMRFDPDTLEAEWHFHIQEVLEGDRGGFSSIGGGCGCR